MERPPLATHSITGRAQSTRSSGPKTVTVLPPSPPSTTPTINPKIDSIWRINDPPLPTTWGTAWRGRAKARETAAPSPAGVSHAQCWSPGVWEGVGGGDASKCERRRDQAAGVTVSASSSSRVHPAKFSPRRNGDQALDVRTPDRLSRGLDIHHHNGDATKLDRVRRGRRTRQPCPAGSPVL